MPGRAGPWGGQLQSDFQPAGKAEGAFCPNSSALSCRGSVCPRGFSSIQQTRSACLRLGAGRPGWQEDSPSPPQRRWAASVTGIFFLPLSLCPSHPPPWSVRPPLFPTSPSTGHLTFLYLEQLSPSSQLSPCHPSVLGSGDTPPPPGSPSGS